MKYIIYIIIIRNNYLVYSLFQKLQVQKIHLINTKQYCVIRYFPYYLPIRIPILISDSKLTEKCICLTIIIFFSKNRFLSKKVLQFLCNFWYQVCKDNISGSQKLKLKVFV